MSNILIVYYSRKGQNYCSGSIRDLEKGNTEIVAEMISNLTGGDLFEIETVKEYPADYYACTDEAKQELKSDARPELKAYPDSIDGYDMLYGFIAGVLAGNYDIVEVYLDGVLKLGHHDLDALGALLPKLAALTGDSVKMVITVSADMEALPESVKQFA